MAGGRPEQAVRVSDLKLVFRDFSPRSLAGEKVARWSPFGVIRETASFAERAAKCDQKDCSQYPMVIHSTRVVSAPIPQDTRGIFAVPTMDGQLPYTETIGCLPCQAKVDIREDQYWNPDLAPRVHKLAYDGENLLVFTVSDYVHVTADGALNLG